MSATQEARISRLEDAVGLMSWWLYQLHIFGLNDVWGLDALIDDGEDWPRKRYAEKSDAAKTAGQESGRTLKELKRDAA